MLNQVYKWFEDCFALLSKAAKCQVLLPQRNSGVFHRGRSKNFEFSAGFPLVFLWD